MEPPPGATAASERPLGAMLRLWTLRPAAGIPELATEAILALLGAAGLALWIGVDGWRAGPGAQFELWDTLTVSTFTLVLLTVAFLMARISRPRVPFRGVLFSLLAAVPLLIAVRVGVDIPSDDRASQWVWALYALYAVAFLWRAMRSLSGASQPGAVLAAVVVLAAFGVYCHAVELSPTLWAPAPEDSDGADVSSSVAESLLFDQKDQIDEAVDGMSPGTSGGPAVFFVGFAGVAEQRVFAEEIKLAAQVVGDRFGAADRQLLLVNDQRDLDTYPIATATGLGYALRAVADKMDPERDILFLALSSHGSPGAQLAVSNGGLPLAQLTDDDLVAALHDSGIKRRIIVISACYAGAFLKPLEDPDTIVITAAAADRTSFGCSNDRDMTYFGEAFFRDALPEAKTLQDAFERARAAIAVREKKEHETPSEPQAFFGSALSEVLDRNPMRDGKPERDSVTVRSAPAQEQKRDARWNSGKRRVIAGGGL
jgi:Peptidase C13 family